MNGSRSSGQTESSSGLEAKVASELRIYLEKIPVGSEFKVEPSADLCYVLELYVPKLLSNYYPEWANESLDGFLVANARKITEITVEICGLCILISDQSVTPFFICFTLNSLYDSIASYRILLGEPGGGRLGISGPPCNSPRAQKMLENVNTHSNIIQWSYTIVSEEI